MVCNTKKNFDITKHTVNIKESLEVIRIKIMLEKLQTLTENIADTSNRTERHGFKQLGSNDIQELLKQSDKDLNKTDLDDISADY